MAIHAPALIGQGESVLENTSSGSARTNKQSQPDMSSAASARSHVEAVGQLNGRLRGLRASEDGVTAMSTSPSTL
jgi:hypothetical protein